MNTRINWLYKNGMIVVVVVVIMVILAIIGARVSNAGANIDSQMHTPDTIQLDAMEMVEASRKQFNTLLSIVQKIEEATSYQVTVKWQGLWRTEHTLEEAAAELANALGYMLLEEKEVHGQQVLYAGPFDVLRLSGYEGDRESAAGTKIKSRLAITSLDNGNYYVILRIEQKLSESMLKELTGRIREEMSVAVFSDGLLGESDGVSVDIAELQTYVALCGAKLAEAGVQVEWNATLQGNVEVVETVDKHVDMNDHYRNSNGDTVNIIYSLEQTVGEVIGIEQIDNYKDEHTISRSYKSTDLPIQIQSASHPIGLQMGVHWNAEQNNYEFSIGSPTITVEY